MRTIEIKGRAWLDAHLETFVKPVLGKIPDVNTNLTQEQDYYIANLSNENVLKSFIDLWEETKKRAKGRTILLPGRDTWLFEVLARIEGVDTIFRGNISSNTAAWCGLYDPDKEVFKKCYAIDSGNSGSVPRALSVADWAMVYYGGGTANHQLLPHNGNNNKYMTCYSVLEGSHKYWTRGVLDPQPSTSTPAPAKFLPTMKIVQGLEPNKTCFLSAALQTMKLAAYWFKIHPEVENLPVRKARIRILMSRMTPERRAELTLGAPTKRPLIRLKKAVSLVKRSLRRAA